MSDTFVTPIINFAKKLGVSIFNEPVPVRNWPMRSDDELTAVIRAIYKQVLGNAHVMESERQQIPEAQFRQGKLSVVELIRQIAKSDLYRSRFFDNGSSTRFLELNFKHFLGRVPENAAELAHYSAILENDGYEAVIDAYLDSDEFVQAFEDQTVPYPRDYATSINAKTVAQVPAKFPRALFGDQSVGLPPLTALSFQSSVSASRTTSGASAYRVSDSDLYLPRNFVDSDTFANPVLNPNSGLGVSVFDESMSVRPSQAGSIDECDAVIRAIYKQVLGNAHVMESERLQGPEEKFRQSQLSVTGLIRQIAMSDLYRTRFFENSSRTRFIELNFKHFLGRAPESTAEIVYHSNILDTGGYEAEIDAYLDSDEYAQVFGADTVPYYRGYKTCAGVNLVGFTHIFSLLRGAAGSDKTAAQSPARLTWSLFSGQASRVTVPSGGVCRLFQSVNYPADSSRTFTSRPLPPETAIQVRSPYAPTAPIQPELSQLRASFAAATPFINPVVNPDQPLGVSAFVNPDPVRRFPTSSADEIELVIRAAYKHILSNAHVMESERLPLPESQFRRGELNVIEFIRQVAYSDMYRTRFFENGSRNRFIELNFKHFLGRAPESLAEIALHSAILENEGYEAEIDSYLDSDEYYQTFGSDTVPYYRGYKTEAATMAGFTHMFSLLRGASSSDKNVTENNPARLTLSLFAEQSSSISPPSGAIGRKIDQTPAEILQDLFKRTAVEEIPVPSSTPEAEPVESELAVKARSQSELITQLKTQLAELRPFSSMGSAILRSGQRPETAGPEPVFGSAQPTASPSGYQSEVATLELSLAQQVTDQAAQIEKLRGELMSAKSLANIADYKLNQWRSRSY